MWSGKSGSEPRLYIPSRRKETPQPAQVSQIDAQARFSTPPVHLFPAGLDAPLSYDELRERPRLLLRRAQPLRSLRLPPVPLGPARVGVRGRRLRHCPPRLRSMGTRRWGEER